MSDLIFIFGVVLWLVLAYSVGSHARGHNRSGVVWFCITAVTGLFGVAFYLLAITSSELDETKTDPKMDQKIIKLLPPSVVGLVIGFFIGHEIVFSLYSTFFPEVTKRGLYYWLIALFGLIGAAIGPKAYFKTKSRLV